MQPLSLRRTRWPGDKEALERSLQPGKAVVRKVVERDGFLQVMPGPLCTLSTCESRIPGCPLGALPTDTINHAYVYKLVSCELMYCILHITGNDHYKQQNGLEPAHLPVGFAVLLCVTWLTPSPRRQSLPVYCTSVHIRQDFMCRDPAGRPPHLPSVAQRHLSSRLGHRLLVRFTLGGFHCTAIFAYSLTR